MNEEAVEDFEDDAMLLAEHGYEARPGSGHQRAVFDRTRAPATSSPPAGATRTARYKGTYDEAFAAFQADAAELARSHWYPTAQTYVPGTWGCGAWVFAFLAMVILIGLIVLAYMIVVRPPGELVVTYEHRPPARVARRRPAQRISGRRASPGPDVADQIRKLAGLRDDGILTEAEFEAKKRQLLRL